MKPLTDFPRAALAAVSGVLLDIDDTLTTEGKLTAEAYSALERLKQAGLIVMPVTGRPAGWCDHIARMWPVDGVVGENGAFFFAHDHAARKLKQYFVTDSQERARRRAQLREIGERILREVPGSAWASDQGYREADIAIDFCEDVPALPRREIERIAALMSGAGLTAKISSIHVNGWFGGYDKLSTTRLALKELFSIDLESKKNYFVFVGDSPNDAPMFAFFPHSVGVANLHDLIDLVATPPTYVTARRCGSGFVEVVDALLAARA